MRQTGNVRRRYVLAVLLVLVVMLRLWNPLLTQLFPAVENDPSSYYIALLVQEAVLWLLPAMLFRPWRYQRLGHKQDVLPFICAALPAGAAIQVFASSLAALLPQTAASAVPSPQTAAEWMLAIPALVLAPALCEEAFYRGSVTTHLLDVSRPGAAAACSALLFALIHGSWSSLPGCLLVSLCCVLLMMASGRLTGPVLLHAGYNGMALMTAFLPGSPWLMAAVLVPAALIICLCLRISWRTEGERHLSREDAVLLVLLLLLMLWRMH